MYQNITPVSSIFKLTKFAPEVINDVQNMGPTYRTKLDNSSNDFIIQVFNDTMSSRNCNIKILGTNANGKHVLECIFTIDNKSETSTIERDDLCTKIKRFFTVTLLKDLIWEKMSGKYLFTAAGLITRMTGEVIGTLQMGVFNVEIICHQTLSNDLEKINFGYRISGDSKYENCVGITTLMQTLDALETTLRSLKPSVPSKPSTPCVPLPCTPSPVPMGGVGSIGPTSNNSNTVPTLRTNPQPYTPSPSPLSPSPSPSPIPSSMPSSSPKKEDLSASKITADEDSLEAPYNTLKSAERETLRQLHKLTFEKFEEKYYPSASSELKAFVDNCNRVFGNDIDTFRFLLLTIGCMEPY